MARGLAPADCGGRGVGQVGDGIRSVVHRHAAADYGQHRVGEGIAQQLADELGAGTLGVEVGAIQQRGEAAPLRAGDLEGAAGFVAQLQAPGQPVVGFGLQPALAESGLFQDVGQEQAAFQSQAGQGEGSGLHGCARAFSIAPVLAFWAGVRRRQPMLTIEFRPSQASLNKGKGSCFHGWGRAPLARQSKDLGWWVST